MSPYLWHFIHDTLLELSLRMPPQNDKFNLMNLYVIYKCMGHTCFPKNLYLDYP